jgi:RimJ/RimL family protein N-acetyltransferase
MRAAVVLLGGARVSLREHVPDDLAAVLGYSADETVARYVPWEPNTDQAARAFLDGAIAAAEQTPRISYELAIVERATGLLIGAARIGIESLLHKRADIGYVLRRDRWGEGLATETARLLLGFGFDQLGMHRIWATSHPENVASARVLEKIGMSYEGRIRDHLFVKGAWRDSLAYAILEPEWRAGPSA